MSTSPSVLPPDHLPAERVTYAELAVRSNRLARLLIAAGCGPEDVVAVALPRGVDLLVALHGVLAAGGCLPAA